MIKQFRTLSLLAFFTSTVGLAAPAPSHSHIHADAHKLLNAVKHLEHVFKHKGYGHLTADSHKLHVAVQHFMTLMHGASPSHAHIKKDFAHVTRHYNHLTHVYGHAHKAHHNAHVATDFHKMQHAYKHLAGVVHKHLSHRPHHGHGHGHPHGHPHH